jgi:hypothetical protein
VKLSLIVAVPAVLVTEMAAKVALLGSIAWSAPPAITTVPPLALKVLSVTSPLKVVLALEAIRLPTVKDPVKESVPLPAVSVPAFPAVAFVLPVTARLFAPPL